MNRREFGIRAFFGGVAAALATVSTASAQSSAPSASAYTPLSVAPTQSELQGLANGLISDTLPPGGLNLSTYLAAVRGIPLVEANLGSGVIPNLSSIERFFGSLGRAIWPIGALLKGTSFDGQKIDSNLGFITDLSRCSFYKAAFGPKFYFNAQPSSTDNSDFTLANGIATGQSSKNSIFLGTQGIAFDIFNQADLDGAIVMGTSLTANQILQLKAQHPTIITSTSELADHLLKSINTTAGIEPTIPESIAFGQLRQIRLAMERVLTDPNLSNLAPPDAQTQFDYTNLKGAFDYAYPNVAASIPLVAADNAAANAPATANSVKAVVQAFRLQHQ